MVFRGRSTVPLLHTDREEGLVRGISMFRTREGQAEAFVEAYGGAANILDDAEGGGGASPHRGVEDPDSFAPIAQRDSGRPGVRHVEAVA